MYVRVGEGKVREKHMVFPPLTAIGHKELLLASYVSSNTRVQGKPPCPTNTTTR